MPRDRLYRIYHGMKSRCHNVNDPTYQRYGKRGIEVCEEWKNDFGAFRQWALANGYSDELSIDRIDNNGNYEPSNCRWATPKQQAVNRRSTKWYTHEGETHCLKEWSEILRLPYPALSYRIKKGMDFEEAISLPFFEERGKAGGVAVSKPVIQLNKNGELISEFASCTEAGRTTKINKSHINQCCLGKRKSAGNYLWKYKGEMI